jgi:hypothetical protein
MMAMHGILSLVLLLPLNAKAGAELKPIPAPKGGDQSVVKPDWTKHMPPESTIDYIKELRRRMAEGQTLRVHTLVQVFLPVALSSLNRDPAHGGLTHGVHVSGTTVEVVSPAKYKGLRLLIHHVTPPSADSCWRAPGCRIEFDCQDRLLEAKQVRLPGVPFIYDRDFKNVTLGKPSAEKATAGKDAGP